MLPYVGDSFPKELSGYRASLDDALQPSPTEIRPVPSADGTQESQTFLRDARLFAHRILQRWTDPLADAPRKEVAHSLR